MSGLKPNQIAALKKLEAALLSCKRAGLVLAGSDDHLLATVEDNEFIEATLRASTCEAMRARDNAGHPLCHAVKHYGCYRDSGGA